MTSGTAAAIEPKFHEHGMKVVDRVLEKDLIE